MNATLRFTPLYIFKILAFALAFTKNNLVNSPTKYQFWLTALQ